MANLASGAQKGCLGCVGLVVVIAALSTLSSGPRTSRNSDSLSTPAPAPALTQEQREFIRSIPKELMKTGVLERWEPPRAYVNPIRWYNLPVDQKKFAVLALCKWCVMNGQRDFVRVMDNRTDKELATGGYGLVTLK